MFTAFLFLVLTLFLGICFQRKKRSNYPPGPPGLPIVGNLLQLGKRPEIALTRWGQKYGKVFSIKLGMENAVVIDDCNLIREALNDPDFSGKLNNEIFDFHSNGAYGVLSSEGQLWESQRRFLLRNLRDFGFGKSSIGALIEDEVREVLEHFAEQQGKPIPVNRSFGLAVLNSLWKITCGVRFSQKDPKLQDILNKMTDALTSINETGLNFAPWLRYVVPELSGYNNLMKVKSVWHKMFTETIEEHINTFSEDHSRDFIDQYLKEVNKTTDPTSGFYKDSGAAAKNLLAVIADIFLAGSETSSNVLTWSMLYLSTFPEVQAKLQEEIDRVVGSSRSPNLNDRAQLPFAEATLMEILRYSSLVPFGVPHTTMTDCKLDGYNIPKGTTILVNLYSVHRRTEIWGDPENFRPERFLSSDGTRVQKNEALMPFQTGKRQCLGESLARDTLFLFIVSIFQRFSAVPDPQQSNSGFESEPSFLRMSKPFRVIFTDRQN